MQARYDIVILGGGTAGWFTAAALSKLCDKKYKICVIESKRIGRIGVGESVTPHVQNFLNHLGIDTHHWMSETGAVYKLANKFQSWVDNSGSDVEFFGFEYATDAVRLQQEITAPVSVSDWLIDEDKLKTTDVFLAAHRQGLVGKFDQYFNSSYHYMVKNRAPFVDQKYLLAPWASWTQHLNAERSADYVRDNVALPCGVDVIDTEIVSMTHKDGHVTALIDHTGREIQAKLFVDASGFHRKIINTLGWKFVPYTDMMIDRALVVQLDYQDAASEMTNYTSSLARDHGWQFRIGLYHRIGTGYCYSSSHLSDDRALEQLSSWCSHKRFQPRLIKWTPGRLQQLASGNVVAIGLSTGIVEPLEANALYVVINGIYHLLATLEQQDFDNLDWSEYNKKMIHSIEDVKDFIQVHYTLSQRSDSDFWNDQRLIGSEHQHSELVKNKYFDPKNFLRTSRQTWTFAPDYLWLQFALAWRLDTMSWQRTIDQSIIDIGAQYWNSKYHKHDLISSSTQNNFDWHQQHIFHGLEPQEWEQRYIKQHPKP